MSPRDTRALPAGEYDVVVVGLGAFGAATLWTLAREGLRCLGIDRYRPPHSLGSTHGGSRLFRRTGFEAPFYGPLAEVAEQGWRELENELGRRLMTPVQLVFLGPPGRELIEGVTLAGEVTGADLEELDALELAARIPHLNTERYVQSDTLAFAENGAFVLSPEEAVRSFLELAAASGAEVLTNTPVARLRQRDDGVEVLTASHMFSSRHCVLACGAWTSSLLSGLEQHLEVRRETVHWYESDTSTSEQAGRSVFLWQLEDGRIWYLFAVAAGVIKVGIHHGGATTEPDAVARDVSAREVAAMSELLDRHLSNARFRHLRSEVCLYTNAPDLHFVIDRLSPQSRLIVATAGSGHGFKFAPVVGRLVADLALDRSSAVDRSPFSLSRLGASRQHVGGSR